MERVCLIAILMNAVAAQYSDPMSGILDGLVAHASLTPTERLATIGAGWMQPWLYSNQYSSINSMKSWSQPLRSPSTMYTFSDVYSWLFHQALAIRPLETNCYLSAFGAWDTYFNTSTRRDILYYLSLDVPTWMQNYDDGQYRETVSISFNYKADDGSVGEIQYTADSIVRVDIQPREWYTRALPWILRNSRMTENGVCGSNVTRVYDCFFDEKKAVSPHQQLECWLLVMCKYFQKLDGQMEVIRMPPSDQNQTILTLLLGLLKGCQ
jgi:hypothetical protein